MKPAIYVWSKTLVEKEGYTVVTGQATGASLQDPKTIQT